MRLIALRNFIHKKRNFVRDNLFYLNIKTLSLIILSDKFKNINLIRWRFAYFKLIILNECFVSSGVKPVLVLGTLLGCIRNSTFAGRPADLDLMLYGSDLDNLTSSLSAAGFKIERKFGYQTGHVLKVYGYGPPTDLIIPECEIHGGKNYLVFRKANAKKVFSIALVDYNSSNQEKIYDHKFYVPGNAEKYLVKWYGERWTVPQKSRPKSNLPKE